MDALLFLSHRLPFPPNKGDKVRSYHFLQHLAKRHRVFLGTFIDDASDWEHVEAVRALCADVHVEALIPWRNKVRSIAAVLTGEAMTLPYFRSKTMHAWVEDIVRRESVSRAFIFSSPMAQYVLGSQSLRRVVDYVDLDSAKWGDYAQRRQWPLSAVYRREASRLLRFERAIGATCEANVFVTDQETQLFCKAAPECASRSTTIRNGVDTAFFAPSPDFKSPFLPGEQPIVFTGAMDYWPNVDAVSWFAREVMPKILNVDPLARFYIVGMNPAPAVRSLASDPAVVVTGRVVDVRPYLQHARVVVAPLRVARGIQNKVLEAMAMARPTVVTDAAAASLSVRVGIDLEVASAADQFAAKVLTLMDLREGGRMGRAARLRVLSEYTWQANLKLLDDLLERGGDEPARSAESSLARSLPASQTNVILP